MFPVFMLYPADPEVKAQHNTTCKSARSIKRNSVVLMLNGFENDGVIIPAVCNLLFFNLHQTRLEIAVPLTECS